VEPLGSSSAIPAPAITAARTLGPVQFSTTTTLSGKVSTVAIIHGVQFRKYDHYSHRFGNRVSFKDFTLGWAELHHFMDVNEWATDTPSMTMDNRGSSIRGWTGGQVAGMCIPGVTNG
jgi:hypothetical protein